MALAIIIGSLLAYRQSLPAATVPYDIVYVRAPRSGNDKQIKWADVFAPMNMSAGTDLMLLHPDGKEEVLVAGGKGAVTDPCVSFDAQWVYYSYLPDVETVSPVNNVPTAGADVFKINLKSRQIVRLTHQEYTPNTSVRTDPLPYGVFNMGACPVAGGRVVFTSTRNGFIPPKQYTPVTSQLFVMDDDGANVRAIAPMTLGAALHPFQLKDGRIAFSTQEAQGLRDRRVWALWAIWPDGRAWEPLMSAFMFGSALHFATQTSSEDIVVEDYYNLNNMGFGSFYRFPTGGPRDTPRFHPAARADNPPLPYTGATGSRHALRYSFAPAGIQVLTPFSTMLDEAAAPGGGAGDSSRLGKVTQPSAAPNNDLLLVWSPGPVNLLPRPVTIPAPDAGLYLARRSDVIEHPSDLVLIKNDPTYNEIWPRAVVPYRAIFGVDEPSDLSFLPNDGTAHPALPEGTPYGIIGTSSLYKRESFPGYTALGPKVYDGLEPFNAPGEALNSNWVIQGADAGRYGDDEIAAVRILLMEPQTQMAGAGGPKFFNHVNERLRILGEIPVRKSRSDGSAVLDAEGNPDTSFWAKVPADTPFTFQMLDRSGRVLTMAQTWHQVRPGEVRVNCGGCHAHSQKPLPFEGTAASKLAPIDLTLQPAHDVEFTRDIRPILQNKCVTCHKGESARAPGQLSLDDASDVAGAYPDDQELRTPMDYTKLARDRAARWGMKPPAGAHQQWVDANVSRYARVFQSRRSLLGWKLAGQRTDGWSNNQWESSAPFANDASRHTWDIDFEQGTVDHARILTEAERRLVYAWIDLALPIDLGGGYYRDENRPTLTVKVANGTVLVGAADAYSGLDEASLSLTVNGASATLAKRGGGVWTAVAPPGDATIVARVNDRAGNVTELKVQPRRPANTSSVRSFDAVTASTVAAATGVAIETAITSPTADGVRLALEPVVSKLGQPEALTFAPDGRLFVAGRFGAVQVVDLASRASTMTLLPDANRSRTSDLTLDPAFSRNGFVYTLTSATEADGTTASMLSRFREAGGLLAQRSVLLQNIPGGNGGPRVRFGPDGMMFIATSDTAPRSEAQDLASMAGKILRLTPDGSSPKDNPFSSPVFAWGHQGAATMSWHPSSGRLWSIAAGEDGRTTVTVINRATDQGWPDRVPEGVITIVAADSRPLDERRSAALFYRGTTFPSFVNDLFVTSPDGAQLLRIHQPTETGSLAMSVLVSVRGGTIRDLATGPDGCLYLALSASTGSPTDLSGRVIRVVPVP